MPGIKSLLKTLGYRAAVASGWPRRRRARDGGAAIFCFHNVVADGPDAARGERSLHVPRAAFAEYAAWMGATFEMVPLAEVVTRVAARRSVRGLGAVSFDDAYRGVFRHALPTLAARAIPATIFVVSGASAARATFWWDRLADAGLLDDATRDRCLGALQGDAARIDAAFPAVREHPLPEDFAAEGWDGVRAARGALTALGAHTVTHRNLASIAPDDARAELARSRDAIAEATGERPTLAAYPYGGITPPVLEGARAEGFAGGMSMEARLAGSGANPFALPRLNVPAGITIDALDCWASGLRLRR